MGRDLMHALRALRRRPGFAAVAIVTLALGIGANCAIFSVLNAVVLEPLAYPDAGRLVRIYGTDRERSELGNVSPMDFLDWKERLEVRPKSLMPSVASAMGPDSRRRDEGDAVASGRSGNEEDGPMPPQPEGPLEVAGDSGVAPRRRCAEASTPRRALDSPRETQRRTAPDFSAGPPAAFDALTAFTSFRATLLEGGEPRRLDGLQVTPGYFELLGVAPLLGRGFDAAAGEPGAPRLLVLSHGFWRTALGGDPAVIGRSLSFDEGPMQVIGVMPAGFTAPSQSAADVKMWTNLRIDPERHGRGGHWLQAYGRLRPGVGLEEARAELDAVMLALAGEYPATNANERTRVLTLQESVVGGVRPLLVVLLGAVGFLLLIACTNVANLLLARAVTRESELAVRQALGAGRGRLLRQMLSESLVLATLGGVAGLLVGSWSLDLLVSVLPAELPRAGAIDMDGRVLAFTAATALGTGLLFGLVPAWRASSPRPGTALKEGARGSEGRRGGRLRGALVMGQVALALMLLVGAGMFLRSFERLLEVDPGFRAENVLTLRLSLPRERYPEPAASVDFYRELSERVASLPGVDAVGATNARPLGTSRSCDSFSLADLGPFDPENAPCADARVITPDYFQAMGIPVLRGRGFDDGDRAEAAPVVVINQAMAKRYFPGEDPLGRRFKWSPWETDVPWSTIVGVIGDVHHLGLGADAPTEVYSVHRQYPFPRTLTLAVRSSVDPERLVPSVRGQVQALDPRLPLTRIASLEEVVDRSVAGERFAALLLGLFAGLALSLATIGVFGVVSFAVGRRVREIGVRMALGAGRRQIYRLILGQGMALAAGGAALGLLGALALSPLLAPLLFGLQPVDLPTLLLAPLLLATVALLACAAPARRATRIEPIRALRDE